jgi:hypothetical protein
MKEKEEGMIEKDERMEERKEQGMKEIKTA